MYLVDADVLLHATIPSAARHRQAVSWLDDRLAGRAATVGLPWHSLFGFVQAVAGPRLLDPPVELGQAWRRVQRWLDSPAAWVPTPGRQHAHLATEIINRQPVLPALSASTVHLAALALENGLTLVSTNRAFECLPHVRRHNPLTG